ncbi:MAG: serine hydrolase domain-containing protein [Gemmatimonadaceae bacterium]
MRSLPRLADGAGPPRRRMTVAARRMTVKARRTIALLILLSITVLPNALGAQDMRTTWPAVDSLFRAGDRPGSPGCAVGVAQNGALQYARGYGEGVVEWGTAITPTTVFEMASVSKQFTALAVLLLERDGKLSLEDDVRKWIPELPNYGAVIRLRHLVHHTSGIRDYDPLTLTFVRRAGKVIGFDVGAYGVSGLSFLKEQ